MCRAAQHKLHLAVAERVPFACRICDRRFATEYLRERHSCQLPSLGGTTAETLMGRGVAQFRFVIVLDDTVKEILDERCVIVLDDVVKDSG
jgi:hypothetical protein